MKRFSEFVGLLVLGVMSVASYKLMIQNELIDTNRKNRKQDSSDKGSEGNAG
ncbi:MAG: hypothetical protein V2A53_04570 [bacterium]